MENRGLRNAAVLVAVLSAFGCAQLPKKSAEFDAASKEMKSIAVMAPGFELQQVGMFSAAMVAEMNHDIEMVLKEAADEVVEASALSVAKLDISDEALAQNPELRNALYNQEAAAQRVYLALDGTGKSINIPYDGDPDLFADAAECDYLAFIRGTGYFTTGAAQATDVALSLLFGGPTTPDTSTFLTGFIVDANLGKVIWYNEVKRDSSDPRKRSNLCDSVKKLFEPLLGKSTVKWDDNRDEELIDKYKAKANAAEAAGTKS